MLQVRLYVEFGPDNFPFIASSNTINRVLESEFRIFQIGVSDSTVITMMGVRKKVDLAFVLNARRNIIHPRKKRKK